MFRLLVGVEKCMLECHYSFFFRHVTMKLRKARQKSLNHKMQKSICVFKNDINVKIQRYPKTVNF